MGLEHDYKAMSLLLGGPRYYDKLRAILGSVEGSLRDVLARAIESCGQGDPDVPRTQYTSCFVANIKGVPVPPYESWYREGRIYGRVVHDLAKWYRKYGVSPTTVPEDHASAELEFAAVLYGSGLVEEGDRFVREHVLSWMGRLAEDVLRKCEDRCVRSIGMALAAFLEREIARLKQPDIDTKIS